MKKCKLTKHECRTDNLTENSPAPENFATEPTGVPQNLRPHMDSLQDSLFDISNPDTEHPQKSDYPVTLARHDIESFFL